MRNWGELRIDVSASPGNVSASPGTAQIPQLVLTVPHYAIAMPLADPGRTNTSPTRSSPNIHTPGQDLTRRLTNSHGPAAKLLKLRHQGWSEAAEAQQL